MSSIIRAKNEESSEQPTLITSFPDDILLDILALVPQCNYPTLSLVSKRFQSLVVSPEIYARRSLLRCTENYLYVLLFSNPATNGRWHVLSQNSNGNRSLALISSLLDFPSCDCFVAVGSRIYAFGESRLDMPTSSSAFSIDCRYHTMQTLPSIPIPMGGICAVFMDGKIYVFGHCCMKSKVMVVFNTETQMWEHGLIKPDTAPVEAWEYGCAVVMADKIYIRYNLDSFIYVPKESKWETDDMLNSMDWGYNPCVVDDVLYFYDECLRAYDPKQKFWGVVNGLEELSAEVKWPYCADSTCSGGKLTLSFLKKEVELLWCAEISLEKRQGGKIWGTVEWCEQVMDEECDFTTPVSVIV